MPLNLGPSYGAGGVADALQQLVAQRRADELLQLAKQKQEAELTRQRQQDTITQQLAARKLSLENADMASGTSILQSDFDQREGPNGSAPIVSVTNDATPERVNRFKAVPIPGVPALGVGGTSFRPITMEEGQAAAEQKRQFGLDDFEDKAAITARYREPKETPEQASARRIQEHQAMRRFDVANPMPSTTGSGGAGPEPTMAPDPASANILSQTGLSIMAFRTLTGQTSQLPRDAATRTRAAREAETWARAHNVDISTLPSQFKAQNAVLERNIERLNNTKIMEQELAGTVENLQTVIGSDFTPARFANVARIWAGEQVNDPTAQQYAFHLGQLRNELAAYYAAAAGRPGSGITITDLQEAERTIKNGISQGGLKGMADAVHNSTAKMGPIMQSSVDRAQRAVWGLFGVGQNYREAGSPNPQSEGGTTGAGGAIEEWVRGPDGKMVKKGGR